MKRIDFRPGPPRQDTARSSSIGPTLSSLVKARAVGGPRDGVLLEALPNWNGTVSKPIPGSNQSKPYPGRYVLDVHPDTYRVLWVWQESTPVRSAGARTPHKEKS